MVNGKYYTVKQIAEKLQVSTRTIHRWIANGVFNYARVNNTIRISSEEFERVFSTTKSK